MVRKHPASIPACLTSAPNYFADYPQPGPAEVEGSAQVLPLLDRELAERAAKVFIGYSDLTSVLTFLTLSCNLVAFHGPMLAGRLGRGAEGYDADSFERAVCRVEPMGEPLLDALARVLKRRYASRWPTDS